MATEKPAEHYVVWEEERDFGSLAWATRFAQLQTQAGKACVQVRQRANLTEETNGDGITHWTYDDVLVQDAFGEEVG